MTAAGLFASLGGFGAVLCTAPKTAAAPRYSICRQCGEQNKIPRRKAGDFYDRADGCFIFGRAVLAAFAFGGTGDAGPAARRLAAVGIGFAGGWAVLYGALMPFGLGLTLGLAEDCFAPCAAGAALGLLLHGLGALSLRSLCQLCALGAAVAARWLLPQSLSPPRWRAAVH